MLHVTFLCNWLIKHLLCNYVFHNYKLIYVHVLGQYPFFMLLNLQKLLTAPLTSGIWRLLAFSNHLMYLFSLFTVCRNSWYVCLYFSDVIKYNLDVNNFLFSVFPLFYSQLLSARCYSTPLQTFIRIHSKRFMFTNRMICTDTGFLPRIIIIIIISGNIYRADRKRYCIIEGDSMWYERFAVLVAADANQSVIDAALLPV